MTLRQEQPSCRRPQPHRVPEPEQAGFGEDRDGWLRCRRLRYTKIPACVLPEHMASPQAAAAWWWRFLPKWQKAEPNNHPVYAMHMPFGGSGVTNGSARCYLCAVWPMFCNSTHCACMQRGFHHATSLHIALASVESMRGQDCQQEETLYITYVSNICR